ncbi:unnamed protein product [Penicillium egyptiacum]|uniref:Uncharacterized protein n=1 Tax=Penicillium egyptiacum TaxID=1303716 RepID=A0A9W4KA32_9EURO|nr:unnamed protein product [Penicillium egyptiacum]
MLPEEGVFLFDVREMISWPKLLHLPKQILLRLTPTLYTQFLFDGNLDFFLKICAREKKMHNVPESSTVKIIASLFYYYFPFWEGLAQLLRRHDLRETFANSHRFLRETIEEYVLTPTLLPNLLLATRTALFPANTRPIPQIATGHIEAPASALQSVQTPTPSQKALAPTASPNTPIAEGGRGPDTDVISKTNNPGNSSNSGNTGGGASTATSARPSSLSAVAADLPTPPELNDPAEPVKPNSPSSTEIAAIKRRCAASLLAVIPRSVVRTLLGVPSSAPPPPYSRDGTCSSNSSPSLVTSPPPSPRTHLRSFQEGKENLASSNSTLPSDRCPVACGHVTAERLRTDDDPSAGIDCQERHLLETIEHDFLDLFADEYCNKHLVWSIIETVLAKVLPEMAERSVEDLLEDRGVASVPPAFV